LLWDGKTKQLYVYACQDGWLLVDGDVKPGAWRRA
jgi:hypothetical protein